MMRPPADMPTRYLSAIALLFLAATAIASPSDSCASTETAPGVQLTLRIPTGQTSFREGEIIPLELSFSSSIDNRYWFEYKSGDTSGRMGVDGYCLEPDARDPIADYFRSGLFMGGGPFSEHQLTRAKPFVATSELNEQKQLVPGHYRLYMVSNRVLRRAEPHESAPLGLKGIDLLSNTIEFDVINAEPEWQETQLREATAAYQSGTDEEKRAAARKLRYLNTRPAVETLSRLYWDSSEQPGGFDLMFGLFGSSDRAEAVAALRREINNPDHPITRDFLNTLVKLEINSDPSWDPPTRDPANPASSDEFWRKWETHERDLMRTSMAETAAALPQKTSCAYAMTANGLAELAEYPRQKRLNPEPPCNPAILTSAK
jgi:hypothetical protein